MTVRYYPGTTDPDLSARANAPTAQAAESMPAVLREQERIAFKDAHRHLELYEVPDAWGRPMFKHSHVEASWFGWIARASHEQASSQAGEYPALVCDYCGALTPDPWHSSGMLHGKMSKHIHSCDACAAVPAQAAAPIKTLEEAIAHAEDKAKGTSACAMEHAKLAAWLTELQLLRAARTARAPADSVLEDAARWHWMAEYIVGTRTDLDDEIIASATVDELRKLVDADLAARKQGASHDR